MRMQTAGQLLFDSCDVSNRSIEGESWVFAGNIGSCNDVDLVAQVVKSQQTVEEHQYAIGN